MPVQKVLIVDDSKTETLLMTAILQENGYSVASAEGADEAMERMAKERPELILMDVVMPGASGFQITRALARDPDTQAIPVVLCTSKGTETDRIWGMRQGARDYLIKPIRPDELLSKIAFLMA